jgi:hypothetical protein
VRGGEGGDAVQSLDAAGQVTRGKEGAPGRDAGNEDQADPRRQRNAP